LEFLPETEEEGISNIGPPAGHSSNDVIKNLDNAGNHVAYLPGLLEPTVNDISNIAEDDVTW
jgi:hypothetical protein